MSDTEVQPRAVIRNDLLTSSEAEQILKNVLRETSTDAQLLNYEVVSECGATGFLGEYFHLKLKYQVKESDEVKTTQLFVKALPFQNPEMTAILAGCGMLVKEAAIYERLLNELSKLTETLWCPQCYFTRHDLFVMENLADYGYVPIKDPGEFLTKSQLDMLLKSLATMHACSITYEVRNHVNIGEQLKDALQELTVLSSSRFHTAGLEAVSAVARIHPGYQSATLQKFITDELPEHMDSVYEMVNPSKKYRNAFCHRDVWAGNFFYHTSQPDKKPVVLVDYQLARYSPPAIDVLMAVYMTITPEQRRTLKGWCYDTYYGYFADELKRQEVDVEQELNRKEFDQSVKALELWGALYNCTTATVLRVPGDYLKNLKLNHPYDFYRYTNVDRVDEVLKLVNTDEKFKKYMFACVDEMLQLLL